HFLHAYRRLDDDFVVFGTNFVRICHTLVIDNLGATPGIRGRGIRPYHLVCDRFRFIVLIDEFERRSVVASP
ncbi:hypothetical protein PFISCL1PPCAC_20924, partial [Pristionchus fissidentatus]